MMHKSVHMRDQKANQMAMLKRSTLDSLEELLLLLAFGGLGLLVAMSS